MRPNKIGEVITVATNFTGFRMNATTTGVDLYLHGQIIDDSNKLIMRWLGIKEGYVLPCDIREQLTGLKGRPLRVYINSPGGDVVSGLAIANMLARHDAPVTAYVDGLAASMASVIFLSCQKRVMPSNTFLMIHRPSGMVQGNADDMLKAAETLETVGKGLMSTYRAAALKGVTEEQIQADMARETWYTAEDAAKMFKIEVKEAKNDIKMTALAGNALDRFQNIPAFLLPEQGENKTEEEAKKASKAALDRRKARILRDIYGL